MADVTQIHQIILNLCTNAYHAMKETGGSIEVSLNEINDCSHDSYISGKQLAQELLKLEPDLPVILSTGHNDIINKGEAEKLGIRKYLMKPFKLSALEQTIAECLSAKD